MWPPKNPYLEVYNPDMGQDCRIAIDKHKKFSSLNEKMFAVRFYPGRYHAGWDTGLKLKSLNSFETTAFHNHPGEGFCLVVPTPRNLGAVLADVDVICHEKAFSFWYFDNRLETYERMSKLRLEHPTHGEWIIGKVESRFSKIIKGNQGDHCGLKIDILDASAILKEPEGIKFLSVLFADSHEIYVLTKEYPSIKEDLRELSAISEFCFHTLPL